MSDFFGESQGESQINYKPSPHAFTDPVRYFKANDPYYWEVDNIPITQLQSNILWLKDQLSVGGVVEVGDVKRSNFTELRPTSTGDNRIVTVEPGSFIGRVNDAYGTGISKLVVDAYAKYSSAIYSEQRSVNISDTVLYKLIGDTVNSLVGNNGLYDYLQTHVSNHYTTDLVGWGNFYTFDTKNEKDGIYDIPKIKLALWQQDTTTRTYTLKNFPTQTGLQQLAVEWTRAWGAPFRTALVNVENNISIEVPPFSDEDYVNETTYIPAVRVDLLFVYTKPVDASSTTIAKNVGDIPATLTSPQLGIVKGAGVISLNGAGGWGNVESVNSTFLQGSEYQNNREDQDYWFDSANAFGSLGNPQIASPVGDVMQEDMGTSGVFSNFPSPDDLMNLAPYLADELNGQKAPALIGQSVLPLAYIFVKKGAASITTNDILDIRPFFRTAELAYNERAGLAAANPPTSLANPVVTDSNLSNRLSHMGKLIPAIELPKLNGAPVDSFFVERTEFLQEPVEVFKKQNMAQLSNKVWTIDGIPAPDMDKIVSVQFRLWFATYDDTLEDNYVQMSGGGVGMHTVARFYGRLKDAKIHRWVSDLAYFDHPVTYTEDEYGVKKLEIATKGVGTNDVNWYMEIWGYKARDTITAVKSTYPY